MDRLVGFGTCALNIIEVGGFDCIENGSGTLVDLGSADNRETTTNLSSGGTARYDASGIIARTRWLGAQGCSGPNRHSTTEQFLFRFTANHNGGCVSGGAIYGNLTKDEDYDPGANNFALYPCGDGGQIYGRVQGGSLQNFTIEGWRFHGCWDPVRLARTDSEVNTDIAVKGSWFTCIRDDVIENDSYSNNQIFEDNLIGDVIGSGPTNSGCFRFYSMAGSTSDHTEKRVTVRNNLVWSSQMKATNRARGINGYAVGTLLKVRQTTGPRMIIQNNVIMADGLAFGGCSGDPLCTLSEAIAGGGSSSGNILIWRDLGNIGSYPFTLPTGFTLLTGSEGESFWNDEVNAWKAAHPNVRRFNKTGIARPFGGTFNLIDTG